NSGASSPSAAAPSIWPRRMPGSSSTNPKRHWTCQSPRSNRDKDWPYVTAIGARMIGMGDERGWLHIYDENLLRRFGNATKQAADFCQRRPALKLAARHDP